MAVCYFFSKVFSLSIITSAFFNKYINTVRLPKNKDVDKADLKTDSY